MIGTSPNRLLALAALFLLPGWGLAQVDAAALARDTHIFRRLFDDLGCKPIASQPELEAEDPRETVVVILGDTTILPGIGINSYVARGGSLLIASDRPLDPATSKSASGAGESV
jgi:hypothetical protein